ncbi:MAG: glutamine amidotransferase [Oscillospiraceae bacterium]|nr:glutamine amidotransferase [Oscillospiraceae bacterium]
MELKICHLYPDILNLYGDRGNVTCLKKRLEWRGIDCTVEGISIGQKLDASQYDLFFIGGGQDFEQEVLLEDLRGDKSLQIKSAIEDEKPFLAICGGYQILGSYYKTWDGQQCDFIGALDLYTIGHKDRMIGNYMYTCDDLEGQTVVGFENHSGKTYLGSGVRPIGRVLSGFGNNGEDGFEGARYKNVYATYSHGCLLPKNPAIADMLLRWALERKYPNVSLAALDDTLEHGAHSYMEARLRAAQNH